MREDMPLDAKKKAFIAFLMEQKVLQFGDFLLKSGRKSPYFFNLGVIASPEGLAVLGQAYAELIASHLRLQPEIIFGPAYKGIPIAVHTSFALLQKEMATQYAADRKEAKKHGETGLFLGANCAHKRVVIVDDVITAGTAMRQLIPKLQEQSATIVGAVLALDRGEPFAFNQSKTAMQALADDFSIPVYSLVTIHEVIAYLRAQSEYVSTAEAIEAHLDALAKETKN